MTKRIQYVLPYPARAIENILDRPSLVPANQYPNLHQQDAFIKIASRNRRAYYLYDSHLNYTFEIDIDNLIIITFRRRTSRRRRFTICRTRLGVSLKILKHSMNKEIIIYRFRVTGHPLHIIFYASYGSIMFMYIVLIFWIHSNGQRILE